MTHTIILNGRYDLLYTEGWIFKKYYTLDNLGKRTYVTKEEADLLKLKFKNNIKMATNE